MLETYKAELYGDRIVWQGEPPKAMPEAVNIIVTILNEKPMPSKTDGKKMAAALTGIAAAEGAVAAIKDASEWKREQRQDRQIAQRED